jgi:nicotinamidase/pyrazinamidase
VSLIDTIFYKGIDKNVDSYSLVKDADGKEHEDFLEYMKRNEIDEIEVVGLALDFCVNQTIKHLIEFGYKVSLNRKLTKAIDKTGAKTIIKELKKIGVHII